MARPFRIEYPGALYHVTSRGNRKEAIYEDNQDYESYLNILKDVCQHHNWICYAYCLMDNHYHLLIETPEANLSKGMRQLNGRYTQKFNRLHDRVGHVFQGRYKAILVEKECYLLELSRYIVLNPVRAGMVESPVYWEWSSYGAMVSLNGIPDWLARNSVLGLFGQTEFEAIEAYKRFITEGIEKDSPWKNLKNQIFLGDEKFIQHSQKKVIQDKDLSEIPALQRREPGKSLDYYAQKYSNRNDAIFKAYQSGSYSLKQIGNYFGLHYSTVSGIVKNHKSKT